MTQFGNIAQKFTDMFKNRYTEVSKKWSWILKPHLKNE